MNPENLSRRDFLKLLMLFSIAGSGLTFRPNLLKRENGPGDSEDLPDILILVFDSFSAKHIPFFGYPRDTTPNLARFANRSTVFHRHYAGGNFTLPGTASLLTGAYPWSHRGLHLFGSVKEEFVDRNLFSVFTDDYFISTYTQNVLVMGLFDQFQKHIDQLVPPKDLALLSEPLSDRLFEKDYFISFWGERVIRGSGVDLPGSLFLSYTGIGEDFHSFTPENLKQEYSDLFPRGLPNHSVGLFFLLEEAIDWIKTQLVEAPRPLLGYYHMLPPHEPYKPRREFIDIFNDGWKPPSKPILIFPQNRPEEALERQRREYDEYIAYVDAEFGRLLDFLENSGAMDHTVVIVTSDHGQLFERGIHGHVTSTLYDPVIHVPLLISRPGQNRRQDVFTPTSCVDLLPTLMHLTRKTIPDWCAGRILPTFGGAEPDPDRSIYVVEAKQNPKAGPLKVGTTALIKGQYKLVRYFGYDGPKEFFEAYDLMEDPDEMENRYESGLTRGPISDMKGELIAQMDEVNRGT
jgi:arylsulfatase A-like enzyme